jgi:DNA repair protein RadC
VGFFVSFDLIMFHTMERPQDSLSIKNWAEEDRPREKLLLKGKSSLTEVELIAIIIGSGTSKLSAVEVARSILSAHENDLHQIARLSITDLKKFKGIGTAKAIAIIAALELGRRRKEGAVTHKPKISDAQGVYQLMKPELLDLNHEQFWLLLLKRNNEVIQKIQLSKGGVSGTVVDAKLIFKHAVELLASSIILVHNHPSGNHQPSTADIKITNQLKEAGRVMDIPILDHVIFTNERYFSFADESIL